MRSTSVMACSSRAVGNKAFGRSAAVVNRGVEVAARRSGAVSRSRPALMTRAHQFTFGVIHR
jgi:hypothetical protein